MLTRITESIRNPRQERRLWHDSARYTPSLGCIVCPDRALCGGLEVGVPLFDCLDFCCGNPCACDIVCRNQPEYAGHVREISTFALDTIPRAQQLAGPPLPNALPMLFHGFSRAVPIPTPAVALPLARMFNRRDGSARHLSRASLCEYFNLESSSSIILSGTDKDAPIERWWGFGELKRRHLIRTFKSIGVALVTTPNYSVFIDVPRWDDLHAMKRIAIVHHEFVSEGLPAALHVNGRTDTDFRRWTDYIAARPEITHLAYEFTTGTGWEGRQQQHAKWLCELARQVGRPLTLIMRGGFEELPTLARAFAQVSVLETSSFMKTMMRKRASFDGHVDWMPAPTREGAPVDALFAHNVNAMQMRLSQVTESNVKVND